MKPRQHHFYEFFQAEVFLNNEIFQVSIFSWYHINSKYKGNASEKLLENIQCTKESLAVSGKSGAHLA